MHHDQQIIETLQNWLQREGLAANLSGASQVTPDAGATIQGQTRIVEVARAAPTERTPGEAARSWVVTLAPLTVNGQQGARSSEQGYNPQLISDAFAVVEWGSIGATTWAVVDWNRGQQFSVYGSFVRVWGGVTAFGTAAANPTPITRLTAHVTPGESREPAVRTVVYPASIAAAAEAELSVPAYASVLHLSGVIDDVDLEFLGLQGRMIPAGTPIWSARPGIAFIASAGPMAPSFDPNYMTKCFRLPMGTNFLAVTLGAAANPFLAARVRYELALS